MEKERKIKTISVIALIVAILGLTIAFAALSTTLTIRGTTKVAKGKWDIHFEDLSSATKKGKAEVTGSASINASNRTMIENIDVTLKQPKDEVIYTVDLVNDGTIDAKISEINKPNLGNLANYVEFSAKYDNSEIAVGDVLRSETTKEVTITIRYKEDIQALPESDLSVSLSYEINYVQDDGKEGDKKTTTSDLSDAHSFSRDSWDTIVENAKAGDTSMYKVGEEKEVELGDNLGVHTLRVVNNSTPEECKKEGFSQSACGFVIEFKDVLPSRVMNLNNSNAGGWEKSELRKYINETIYNALPNEIKNGIIDTEVVSGHEKDKTENYKTTDKLYLISAKELWGSKNGGIVGQDSAWEESRQLDYYEINDCRYDNAPAAVKYFSDGSLAPWWLRTPSSPWYDGWVRVLMNGSLYIDNSGDPNGVSPAFRMGK